MQNELTEVDSLFWARQKRIINKKPYKVLPDRKYLVDIYRHFIKEKKSKKIVIQKSAQMGLSEMAINIGMWFIENCGNVLYVLPTRTDAFDFSSGRFNPVIENSPELEKIFTDVMNSGHKRAGERNLYIRGSQSKSQLKSVPVDFVILDEYDEMVQENIPLALDRLDASEYKWELNLSTPTYPEYGINNEYLKSDKREWFVKCSSCGHWQILDFFKNVKLIDGKAELVCSKCGKKSLNRFEGQWVIGDSSKDYIGYHINQLMSPRKTAQELYDNYEEAKKEGIFKLENFYNSKLGLPYAIEGDKLTPQIVKSCMIDEEYKPNLLNFRAIGVDVGTFWDYTISEKGANGVKKVVSVGRCPNPDELIRVVRMWNVKVGVFDKNPERTKVEELINLFSSEGRLFFGCEYIDDAKNFIDMDYSKKLIKVDRTMSLDKSLNRFYSKSITLMRDCPKYFIDMVCSVTRVIEENKRTGKRVARYVQSGADHFAHSNNYNELAFDILVKRFSNSVIW